MVFDFDRAFEGWGESSGSTDASARGERIVALIRICLLGLFAPVMIFRRDAAESIIGLLVYTAAATNAVAIYLWTRRRYRRRISLYSIGTDITMVTAGLVGFLVAQQPLRALNSQVLFEGYFLCLACAGLRFDWRLSLYALGVSLLEIAGVASVALTRFDLGLAFAADPSRGAFDAHEWSGRLVAMVCAGVLSTAVALLGSKWRTLSCLDPLTSLMNRAHFMERAEVELLRSGRRNVPFSLAVVDVDRLKSFNDTYGHASGDAALVKVATLMRRLVRRTDLVARLGGDEFVILFPETGTVQSIGPLESLLARVASEPLGLPHGEARLSVTAGLATWPSDGERLSTVLHRADIRLLEAKRAGRNRIVGPPVKEGPDEVPRPSAPVTADTGRRSETQPS